MAPARAEPIRVSGSRPQLGQLSSFIDELVPLGVSGALRATPMQLHWVPEDMPNTEVTGRVERAQRPTMGRCGPASRDEWADQQKLDYSGLSGARPGYP